MRPISQELEAFTRATPEIVYEWADRETEAKGWLFINSLRGGAAGGGTRMRLGLDRAEVATLAKTMEIKFTVSGPAIGGAKSGINFDPRDPRKDGVLDRWFKAVSPLLKNYYGTGGDLNVDEIRDVIPRLESQGVEHPQEGVLVGHFRPTEQEKNHKIDRLKRGVSLPVESAALTPEPGKFLVADLITGFGVAESVRHYYTLFGGDVTGKTVAIQGWGNVGAAAGYYLASMGARLIAISDKDGGIVRPSGLATTEVEELLRTKVGNSLVSKDKIPAAEMDSAFWNAGANIFIPAAASRLVSEPHVNSLIKRGVELISCGANAPFEEQAMLFGDLTQAIDSRVALIPDFIANAGMARAFSYLMGETSDLSEEAIFADTSRCIKAALTEIRSRAPQRTHIAARAFEIALDKIRSR